MFRALARRFRAQTERNEFYAAQVACAVYNTGYRAPKDAVSVADLMPSARAEKRLKRPAAEKRDPLVIAAEIERVLAAWKPKIIRSDSVSAPPAV